MDYPLYCVIPSSRILHFVPETITFIVGESFSEEDHEVGHHGEEREHHSIDVWLENGMRLKHTDTELGLRFKFNFLYSPLLIYRGCTGQDEALSSD